MCDGYRDASEPLTPKIAESEPETTKSEVQSTEDEEEEYDEDEDDLSSVVRLAARMTSSNQSLKFSSHV